MKMPRWSITLALGVAVVIWTGTASATADKWPKPDYAALEGALNRHGITVCHYDAPPEPDPITGAFESERWYLYRTSDMATCPPNPGSTPPNLSLSDPNFMAALDAWKAAYDAHTHASDSKAAELKVQAFSSQRIYAHAMRSLKQLSTLFERSGDPKEETSWAGKPLILELDLSTQDVTPQVKAAMKKLKAKVFIQGR
jgi:hypothetical protein